MRVTGRAAVPETHCDTWDGDEGLLGHWGVLGFPPPSLLGSLCYGELTAEGDAKKKKVEKFVLKSANCFVLLWLSLLPVPHCSCWGLGQKIHPTGKRRSIAREFGLIRKLNLGQLDRSG